MAAPKIHTGKVGGAFYFFSLFSVVLLASLLTRFSVDFLSTSTINTKISLLQILISLLIGFFIAALVPSKVSVFLHELKHSIISSLAGNKAKSMSYKEDSGDFQYTFTKNTAHLNAFISLAPYLLPIFSIIGLVLQFTVFKADLALGATVSIAALGLDLVLNLKDAGIHQTDLTEIRGGYFLSMTYVLAFNTSWILIVSTLAIYGAQPLLEFLLWLAGNFAEKLIVEKDLYN
jgi:hypothetical protein